MANRSFSSIASHHRLSRTWPHLFAMVGLSFSLAELIPFCVQSLFSHLKFCLAFRCASFGRSPLEQRLIWPEFTFNKHSFRTFLSYQFRPEKQHPTSPTCKCPLAEIPNKICANWRQLVGATIKRAAYPSLHICWPPWMEVWLEIALRGVNNSLIDRSMQIRSFVRTASSAKTMITVERDEPDTQVFAHPCDPYDSFQG